MAKGRILSKPLRGGCTWHMEYVVVRQDCVTYFICGYFMAPEDEERIGDVSNVLFSNGWIADEDGTVFIYYASSDTRMHVATSTIDKLVDYCMNTPVDGLSSSASVDTLKRLIDKNLELLKQQPVSK